MARTSDPAPESQKSRAGKTYPRRVNEEELVGRSLPPQRARAKALDAQVWISDKPKSKRPRKPKDLAAKDLVDKGDVQAQTATSPATSDNAHCVSSATRSLAVPHLLHSAYDGSDGEPPVRNVAASAKPHPMSTVGHSVPRLTLPDDNEQVVPVSSNRMQKNIPKPRSKGQHVSHNDGDTARQDWGDVPDKEMDDEAGYAEEEDYDKAGEVDNGLDRMAPEELEEAMTNEVCYEVL
ncbi:hypothetical protein C8Q72DRAFT_956216 [Fomitopsis betulina]|nr:hypothetical protein C8Q72DRAFT_956216 [Fomitopsis betulina]